MSSCDVSDSYIFREALVLPEAAEWQSLLAGRVCVCDGGFRVDDCAAKIDARAHKKPAEKNGRNVHAGCDAKCGSARPRGVDFVAKIGRELVAIKKAPNSVHRDH